MTVSLQDADRVDVAASRRGDPEAYRRIVVRYQGSVTQRMRRFARSRADIEELVHETFVQAYMSLHTFSERGPFGHWLQRIATRVGYAFWKRRARAKKLARLEDSADPVAKSEKPLDEGGPLLHAILEKLSPRDRMVVTLLHLEERSVAETAEHTGWSAAMVKVQAFRARGRLKKLLEQAGFSEVRHG